MVIVMCIKNKALTHRYYERKQLLEETWYRLLQKSQKTQKLRKMAQECWGKAHGHFSHLLFMTFGWQSSIDSKDCCSLCCDVFLQFCTVRNFIFHLHLNNWNIKKYHSPFLPLSNNIPSCEWCITSIILPEIIFIPWQLLLNVVVSCSPY